jgi:hypothetical protein
VYSTYLGGTYYDYAAAIAVDASGNAYITGETTSHDFPTTPVAFQDTLRGYSDAFFTKLNPAGSALLYSTYLGGSSEDGGRGIAVDASRNVYVTGYTHSSDFPSTSGAFQTSNSGGASDVFVSKLNAAGTALIYSTYLGGSAGEGASAIVIDASGSAYVTGYTNSSDFPTTPGAFQTTRGGAFVTKLYAAGSALLYSTYLGGDNAVGLAIAVDASDNTYIPGCALPQFPHHTRRLPDHISRF